MWGDVARKTYFLRQSHVPCAARSLSLSLCCYAYGRRPFFYGLDFATMIAGLREEIPLADGLHFPLRPTLRRSGGASSGMLDVDLLSTVYQGFLLTR